VKDGWPNIANRNNRSCPLLNSYVTAADVLDAIAETRAARA